TVQTAVQCNIVNNQLIIPSCRVWDQNGNTICTSLTQAGTGSKCDCTDLIVTPSINPCATTTCNDNNACTDDTCTVINRTCAGGTNSGASCTSEGDCTGGGHCTGGAAMCVYTNDNTNTCTDGNACTTDVCVSGSCAATAITCNDNNAC